jgi:hypothetical protein
MVYIKIFAREHHQPSSTIISNAVINHQSSAQTSKALTAVTSIIN